MYVISRVRSRRTPYTRSYTHLTRVRDGSARAADTAYRSGIVVNMINNKLHTSRYVRYDRYTSVILRPVRVCVRTSRPRRRGRARAHRIAPHGAAAGRHRPARITSCLGAAATAVTRLGGRVGHDAAAVGHRLERVDERLQGGVGGAAPRS